MIFLMVSIVHNLSSTIDIVLGKQAGGKVTPAGKTHGSRKSLADDEFPNGLFFHHLVRISLN